MVTRAQITKIPAVRKILGALKARSWSVIFTARRKDYFAHGWCERDPQRGGGKIVVYLVGPDGSPASLATVLFVLAHEYRHFMHLQRGMFRAYYDRHKHTPGQAAQANRGHMMLVGLSAERDCDRFARLWVTENSPSRNTGLMRRKYPIWKVGADVLPLSLRIEKRARIDLAAAVHGHSTQRTIGQLRQKIKEPMRMHEADIEFILQSISIGDVVDAHDTITEYLIDSARKSIVSFEDEEYLTLDSIGDGEVKPGGP